MPRKPIGVWSSIALVILCLGFWAGWKVGERIAVYAYKHRTPPPDSLSPSEAAQIDSALSELYQIQIFAAYSEISSGDSRLRKQPSPETIRALEKLRKTGKVQELQPVVDLNLAYGYAAAAVGMEEDGNTQAASTYLRSAQPLFQSLGWKDYSDEALRSLGEEELATWRPRPGEAR